MSCPRIALTMGDPAGIGPDVLLAGAHHQVQAQLVVIGDPEALEQRARRIGAQIELVRYDPDAAIEPQATGRLLYLSQPLAGPVTPGRPTLCNADNVVCAIERAVQGCASGEFQAMVTGPVHKAVIAAAGHKFKGHTEYIANLCGSTAPVMMLANDFARVALVTTHVPLNQVVARITPRRLRDVIRVVVNDLRSKFDLSEPRALVCGVNPHAGEHGLLGDEENEIITPVVNELKGEGLNLLGPVAADTAFTAASLSNADAVITMYHDQGLPVLKSHGFGKTVNITLGLPIIRTSVDHGTAFDLAGSGRADPASLCAAIDMAVELATRSDRHGAQQLHDRPDLRIIVPHNGTA